MKQIILCLFLLLSFSAMAQVPGDTVRIQTFKYSSTTRDTVIQFPNNPAVQYEKVLMLYNIRCKDGLVSPPVSGQTNIGCGEWDYSCNTYLTDSTRIDSMLLTTPSHQIINFSGTTFPYLTQAYYNLYQYSQAQTTVLNTASETLSNVGTGSLSLTHPLSTDQYSGRSQYIYTAAELLSAGVIAGPIDALLLNVLNAGTANFLKVKMKHTLNATLNAALPDTAGFMETYYSNTSFATGSNRLQFHTPFVWDGVSNIVVDFSFTHSTPAAALQIEGHSASPNMGLYANNNHHVNTASGTWAGLPASPMANLSGNFTVSYWSKGDIGVGTQNTSILEGIDSSNRRQLNIHMPWSNTNIYFDCGNNGSNYNRINKAATIPEVEQNWNYWSFTKNTTTGVMNIYLNGVLWHTGTGMNYLINIDSLVLGTNITKDLPFRGDIDELSIWNTDLTPATIQAWMYLPLTPAHPDYANLIAYYPLNEASGTALTDYSSQSQTGNFNLTPYWKYLRGDQIFKQFNATSERPNLTMAQGSYTLSNQTVTVLDSLPAAPYVVKEYTVYSNIGTNQSDSIGYVSYLLWKASYRYTYDGITGAVIDSTALIPTDSIVITNLNYVSRSPAKYELMSFVTPYGINLNMGMNGKTWTFDVTDYLPILKGNRRLSVERGGQWQENMDIQFLFLVGTPPRDVRNITNIWRQPNNCSYMDIINDKYFEPRNLMMDAGATAFKIRTMVTGHGQEGEFIPRDHYIDINGGSDEFVWPVWKKCASNPLYPQGGTWIYDRAGWCPGMATDLKEVDITPYVTPGQVANIDYGMYTASGSSSYLVSNNLVSYGAFNHTLDAAVADILAPTNKIEYAREHAICDQPKILLQNTGSTPLTSVKIEYWLNNNPVKSSYAWTGNLAPMEKIEVELPNTMIWSGIDSVLNEFHVELKEPNNGSDQYIFNNKMKSVFNLPEVVPADFIIYHKSNLFAGETSYQLFNDAGTQLFQRSGMSNNTIYRDTMHLTSGCYKLVMTDTDEDGISFWANNDGAGVFQLKRITGSNLKTFNPDFGASIIYNFTVDYPLSYEQYMTQTQISVYPNPAQNNFHVEMPGLAQAKVEVMNAMGQRMNLPHQRQGDVMIFDVHGLARGIYYVSIVSEDIRTTKKVVVE
ncbi:MAG: T9SS type A sorting domain-containing protein [Chitinophagaceae bacterium]|nr:T9SS type A sorting domain-containing protein [Chitinophagaceae bacterium]